MDPYIGELRIFPYGFVPKGWAACDGTILNIQGNQALFALLGTIYGGNGTTNFALPDLRGRVPMHVNDTYLEGKPGGANGTALTLQSVPPHVHTLVATTSAADQAMPGGHLLSTVPAATPMYAPPAMPLSPMAVPAIGNTGSATPVSNMQPYLGLDICIALIGIYPPRN